MLPITLKSPIQSSSSLLSPRQLLCRWTKLPLSFSLLLSSSSSSWCSTHPPPHYHHFPSQIPRTLLSTTTPSTTKTTMTLKSSSSSSLSSPPSTTQSMSTPPPRQSPLLILDFDGTLTRKDTLHVVARAGYSNPPPSSPSIPSKPWSEIVDAYSADFASHFAKYTPKREMRRNLVDEVEWLNSLRDVEERSVDRVVGAGVFDGVGVEGMYREVVRSVNVSEEGEGGVELRPGWRGLVEWFDGEYHGREEGEMSVSAVSVVSVNWSRVFISFVLKVAGAQEEERRVGKNRGGQGRLSGWRENMAVYANEVPSIVQEMKRNETIGDDRSVLVLQMGEVGRLRTSGDKVRRLRLIRDGGRAQTLTAPTTTSTTKSANSTGVENDTTKPTVIYVGDSSTDLECLVEASIGICIRDEPMGGSQRELAETCERIGIDVVHVGKAKSKSHLASSSNIGESGRGSRLWWARDFHEIHTFLEESLKRG